MKAVTIKAELATEVDGTTFRNRPLTLREWLRVQEEGLPTGNLERALDVFCDTLLGWDNLEGATYDKQKSGEFNAQLVPVSAIIKVAKAVMENSRLSEEDLGN